MPGVAAPEAHVAVRLAIKSNEVRTRSVQTRCASVIASPLRRPGQRAAYREGTQIVRKPVETVDAGGSRGQKKGRRPKKTPKRRPFETSCHSGGRGFEPRRPRHSTL
jgi:hypothetical protein